MKIKLLFILIMGMLLITFLSAQEQPTLDWDINTIFGEPAEEQTPAETPRPTPTPPRQTTPPAATTPATPVQRAINRRGFLFTPSFRFNVGVAPGWHKNPFDEDWDSEEYYLDRYIRMRNSFTLDAQISEDFRAVTTLFYEIPHFRIQLGNFFFDYKVNDIFFFRGGKFRLSWGISPNYNFTDLLARLPKGDPARDSFIFRTEIPIDKGSFQVLALTRFNLMHSSALPKREDFGFGAKYNIVHSLADLNMGFYYRDRMPLRCFMSIKTTIKGTELYTEGLTAFGINESSNHGVAFNIGFEREIFNRRLNINGELFFNGETDTYWYEAETNIREAITSSFVEGLNMAFNLLYRPWEKYNHRVFFRVLYIPTQYSARIIPGIRLRPWPNLEFYFATPISLGNKNGYYRIHTVTQTNRREPLPFAVVFMVTLSGSVRFRHTY
jgi:hypothetical protein